MTFADVGERHELDPRPERIADRAAEEATQYVALGSGVHRLHLAIGLMARSNAHRRAARDRTTATRFTP